MKPKFKDEAFGGILGKTIRVRQVKGKMLMSNQTRQVNSKVSQKQATVQDRFQAAAQYAKRQLGIPEALALYKTKVTDQKRSAYMVAMADFLSAPKVLSIDSEKYDGSIGSTFSITAKDDFAVTEVRVRLTDTDGVLLEEGQAQTNPGGENQWVYVATVMNTSLAGTKIRAVAFDRPGNKGVLEITL